MPKDILEPGATGESVKALQSYLVSQGLLTQAQMDTGPGIYGGQTRAAVKALQQKLGVNTGGFDGYYGPKTIAAVLGTNPIVPTSTPVPATPSTINSSNTAPVTPIPYTTPNPAPAYPVEYLDPKVPPPQATLTPSETKAQGLTESLTRLNDFMIGKSAYQTEQENAVGLPSLYQAQNDLSSQLIGLQNEAKAIPIQLQNESVGRGITAGGLAPIQSERLRDNAVKALTVSTLLEATKGNIATAQMMADRAVRARYGVVEEQIAAAKANLELILKSPKATVEEKNRAQQQLDIQNARKERVEEEKAKAKEISALAITAAQNTSTFTPTAQYPTVSTALQAISNAKDLVTAAQIANETGLEKAGALNTQIVEVNGRKLLVDTKTGKTIKDLGASSSTSSDGETESERKASALQGYSAAFVPGAKLADGSLVLYNGTNISSPAWKAAIADYKGNREDFIKKYGYLIPTNTKGSETTIDASYGLTPAERKLVLGTS